MRVLLLPCVLLLCRASAAQQPESELAAARSLIQQNKNAEAIQRLKTLAANHPKTKGISRELGIASYHEREYLEAAQYLQEAWRDDPEDRDAAQLLGLSYYSSGKPAEAIPALEKVRMWHRDEGIDAIYILGLCYILTRNYPQARQTFAELYGLPADSAEAHLVVARMLLRQGFDPVAEEEARKALSLAPQLPLAHFTLGESFVYKADYAMAAQEFESELALNRGYAPAYTSLGEAYWRLGRHADAERVVQRSIWLDASNSKSYVLIGKVLLRKKQLSAAERMLQQAVALDAGSYNAHYFLGQLYREEGKADAAEGELKIAARIQQQQGSNAHN
jgi:tetratricopeptide (TPR) repeat protein